MALALACVIVSAYFFWPTTEYVSVRGGVVIVDGFYSLKPDFTDEVTDLARANGMNVDVYKDSEVTVDFYRKLPALGYGLVVLRVHAGILGRNADAPTFLFTNEPYDAGKYFLEQMTDQILGGKIDIDNSEEESVCTVGPRFMTMSMKGSFNNSVIILSSCLGLFTNTTAETLVRKGARAFVSWDEKVDLEHTDRACSLLLRLLLEEGKSLGEATEEVMARVGQDLIYGSKLRYYPENAANVRIKL
jgi:hypothetical protein